MDGFHAIDLANFVADFPTSNLAKLSGQGVTYTQNFVPPPTDSFPGVVNLLTGTRVDARHKLPGRQIISLQLLRELLCRLLN